MPKTLPTNNKEFDLESLRPFSKIKLIALDLDGTMLSTNEFECPEKVIRLALKLKRSKHGSVRVTIATGRTLKGVQHLLENLSISKDTPIILYNGSLIINKKYDIIYQAIIPAESLKRIIELSSRFNVKVIAYAFDWLGKDGLREHAIGWSNLDRPVLEYNKMPVLWKNWDNVVNDINPSAIVIHTSGDYKTNSTLFSELNKIHDITCTRGGTYIEVTPRGSNKGKALKLISNSLGLDNSQVLAMGDNDNDAAMLSWAGIGVAVEAASVLATQSCDYRANQGVIDGAIEVLRLVYQARRLLSK